MGQKRGQNIGIGCIMLGIILAGVAFLFARPHTSESAPVFLGNYGPTPHAAGVYGPQHARYRVNRITTTASSTPQRVLMLFSVPQDDEPARLDTLQRINYFQQIVASYWLLSIDTVPFDAYQPWA